jgi:hypothetical protein
MAESPQSFAAKAAIVEILKRTQGAALSRGQVVDQARQELDTIEPAEISEAIDELKLADEIVSQIVGGEEVLRFPVSPAEKPRSS